MLDFISGLFGDKIAKHNRKEENRISDEECRQVLHMLSDAQLVFDRIKPNKKSKSYFIRENGKHLWMKRLLAVKNISRYPIDLIHISRLMDGTLTAHITSKDCSLEFRQTMISREDGPLPNTYSLLIKNRYGANYRNLKTNSDGYFTGNENANIIVNRLNELHAHVIKHRKTEGIQND